MHEPGVAIQQWQRGVLAIGARRAGADTPILLGTGFIVDLPAGLVSTCAHVVLEALYSAKALDPGLQGANGGLAIGFGTGERIRWVGRADIKYISPPPASYAQQTGRTIPAHWTPPHILQAPRTGYRSAQKSPSSR